MNTTAITYYNEVEKFYFSPMLLLDGIHENDDYLNLYVFLGKSSIFGDGIAEPPEINLSPKEVKNIFKNFIALKKANLSDISPVIQRIDWTENSFYYAYDQNINFGIKGQNGLLLKPFYVRNRYDQVFKCLWNGTTSANSFAITEIANNSTHYTITHEGGTFDVGSLITIDTVNPQEYNGTYTVVASGIGSANVICSFQEQYTMSANNYLSGGRIRNANLSTEEPVLGTGTFNTNTIITTADGYKWKYMYTVDKGSKIKFFDSNWMNIPIKNIEKYPYSANVGWGSIDVINVVAGGNGYTNGTNTVSIVINGDGQKAAAEAYVDNNTIKDISILNKGYDYTFANVYSIPATGYSGSGAELSFSISPIGGHNFDLLKEMYCSDIIVSVQFDRSENGKLPTDFSFNQVGILYNPYLKTDKTNHANTTFIPCTTDMIVTRLGNPFVTGEQVYQGITLEESTFRATVLSFDSSNNYLSLINTYGSPKTNFEIVGSVSNAAKIIQQVFESPYVSNSGNLFYIENRNDEQRDALSSDQIRILINYK
jgi:hypothetical protein